MSVAARYRLPEQLPEEERRALHEARTAGFEARFLQTTHLGVAAAALASVACLTALPSIWALWGVGAAVGVGASLLAIRVAADRKRLGGWTDRFNILLGGLAAVMTGEAAAHGLGVASAGVLVLLVMWMYGTVVIGMPPGQLVLAVCIDSVAYAAPSLVRGLHGGLGIFVALAVGGGAVFALSALERQVVETRTFLTRRRKERTNARLADRAARLSAWSGEIERRVDVQLASVLERRRQVAMLERAVDEASTPVALSGSTASSGRRPTRTLPPGYLLGARARLVHPLGSGGFGDVYLADDLLTGARVVAKVMRCDADTDPVRKKRFALEASAANAVSHRSVVPVLHVDISPEGWPYLLSELVDGVTLRWCLQAHALETVHYLAAMLAATSALQAIHEAGVVHRDLKPDNLMLQCDSPGLRVLDFGISRWAESDDHDLTEAGELIGTVAYMAPEQIMNGRKVTPATDIYALGLTMFECMAGEHPLAGLTFAETLNAQLRGTISSLGARAPLLDQRVVALVDAMLRHEPTERPSIAEVRLRLAEVVPEGDTAESAYAFLELGPLRSRGALASADDIATRG